MCGSDCRGRGAYTLSLSADLIEGPMTDSYRGGAACTCMWRYLTVLLTLAMLWVFVYLDGANPLCIVQDCANTHTPHGMSTHFAICPHTLF